MKRGDLIFSDG